MLDYARYKILSLFLESWLGESVYFAVSQLLRAHSELLRLSNCGLPFCVREETSSLAHSPQQLCWVIVVNLTQAWVAWIVSPLTEELPKSDWAYDYVCEAFSEMGCGRTQPTTIGPFPRLVGLGCMRKTSEQARDSKPVHNCNFPSWSLLSFCLQVPAWLPALASLNDLLTIGWSGDVLAYLLARLKPSCMIHP